jgi:predicted DNA binding CopG/RHH family protein
MPSPKKKLSTKPIKIDFPESIKAESRILESAIQDSANLETKQLDSIQSETSARDPWNSGAEGTATCVQEPDLKSGVPSDSMLLDVQTTDSFVQDSGKRTTQLLNSGQLENVSQNSTFSDLQKADSSIQDSVLLELENQANNNLESMDDFSQKVQSFKPDYQNQEVQNLDSGLEDYKKVAMRLSIAASERLKQLRVTTGIPYEILVDVMIRNWDSLPVRTQTAFLKEAQQIRASRLLAGQQKTMNTMQRKYASK